MTGHNQRVKKGIADQHSKHSIKVIGFTDQFLNYLKASDAILSKAGGLTMAEALACETPIIIFQPVPGHEEQNTQYLTRARAAVKANDYDDLPRLVEQVLYNPVCVSELIHRARQLKQPNAAYHIVREILSHSIKSN